MSPRQAGLLVAVICVLAGAWFLQGRPPPPGVVIAAIEARPGQAQWYRGNLHTHSLWSDGDRFPEVIADQYRRDGYHFLAFSDHDIQLTGERWVDVDATAARKLAYSELKTRFPAEWTRKRMLAGRPQVRLKTFEEIAARVEIPGRFELLQGEEVSDNFNSTSLHLNATNLSQPLLRAGGGSVVAVLQRNIDNVLVSSRLQGHPAMVQVNHPNFMYSITAEQLMRVPGARFFEVYNGHPLSLNQGDVSHPSTERMWDIVLTHRIAALDLPLMYGLATDDSHHHLSLPGGDSKPGRGWVMVLAETLTPRDLIAAMDQGRFYSSTGVKLRQILHTTTRLRVEVAAEPGVEYLIEFIGTQRGFDTHNKPARGRDRELVYASRHYDKEVGRVLSSQRGPIAEHHFDNDDLYVRARVTSSRRHHDPSQPMQYAQAWVQPVHGPAAAQARLEKAVSAPKSARVALHARLTPSFAIVPPSRTATLAKLSTADCNLDQLADDAALEVSSLPRGTGVLFGGWLADRTRPTLPDSLSLVLKAAKAYVAEAHNGSLRPDVAVAYSRPDFDGSGFNLEIGLGGVDPGDYAIVLVGHYDKESVACETGRRLRVL